MKRVMTIKYFPKCNRLLRSACMAQELLTTFSDYLKGITLRLCGLKRFFHISMNNVKVFTGKNLIAFR